MDLPHPPRRHLAGRPAADRRRRGLHLQLHRRPPDGGVHGLHLVDHARHGHRPLHGGLHLYSAQGQHAADVGADPARAHLEQDQLQGRGKHVREPAAGRRQRAVPGGQVGQTPIPRDGRQQALLGRRSQDRRGRLSLLHQRRHHGGGAPAGQHPVRRRDTGPVPAL